jgi:hypothetical protein
MSLSSGSQIWRFIKAPHCGSFVTLFRAMLQGPVFRLPPSESLGWITKWDNGTPMLGWHDTLLYLSVPIILILSQV